MNNVGARIKKIREEKGIVQDFMAYELDISQSNYGRLEKDDRRLNVPKNIKIANVLNMNISMFTWRKGRYYCSA
ncbi:helix-turn-helix domain-containing protein [Chryseobacterium sp. CCH4-E10]|uniref:helix-turn-helix domain-containing protein n=1 Tax=Chryseobacterium sp. CCH4-E10 TaxID=1768758 RepID=UPI000831CDF0|nr:helix-turn-helix transcriptional regulator [Chryseobacterium sp. CCH4-E10]